MLKSSRKGFTLIEIIVVIVILAVLMAIAVPSVMSYMKEGYEAKYLAVSRSAYQNITVEISKLEGGVSKYPNLSSACKAAIVKTNNSSPDELNIAKCIIKYDSTNISILLNRNYTGITTFESKYSVDHIENITFYFGTSIRNVHASTSVYPNKRVEYNPN